MRIQIVSMSGTGPTSALQVDLSRFRGGVGLICTVDFGATALYSVEISGDNVHWNNHDTLHAKVASANGNIGWPVCFVRLNGTSTNGSVTLVMVQAQ